LQRRARLSVLLSRTADYRITLVTAPAGYGKTTMLAELADSTPRTVWYTLSSSDHDPVVFLSHLIAGLRPFLPALAAVSTDAYHHSGRPSPAALESLTAAIVNAVYTSGRLVHVVLDDFHLVAEERTVSRTINWLVQHAPRQLHFILSSRSTPRLPALPRLSAGGDVLNISDEDLRFTQDETQLLLAAQGLDLSPQKLVSVEEETEGWVLGLQLVTQYLSNGGDVEAFRAGLSPARSRLFEYLAEEVLLRQPEALREFMVQSSVLRLLQLDALDAVLGPGDNEELLIRLEAENLFILRLGDDSLRYHNLMHDFLRRRLRQEGGLWEELNCLAAEYYEYAGDDETAYHHWVAAGREERAAQVLTVLAPRAAAHGRLAVVSDWLAGVSDGIKSQYPQLLLSSAHVLQTQGRTHAAFEQYSRAIERLEVVGPSEALADALVGKGGIYRDKGMTDRAAQHYARAFDLLHETDLSGRASVLSRLAIIDASVGELQRAEDRLTTATRLYEEASDAHGQYSAWNNLAQVVRLRQGRFTEAAAAAETAIRLARELRSPIDAADAGLTHATILCMMGEYAQARLICVESLAVGVELGAVQLVVDSLITTGHCLTHGADRDLDAAERSYTEAVVRLSAGDAQSVLSMEALLGRSVLERARGSHRAALNLARQAASAGEKRGHLWFTLLARLDLAIAGWEVGDHEASARLLAECETAFTEYGDAYHLAYTLLWRAATAPDEERTELFRRCLHLVRDGDYLALPACEAAVALPLLVASLADPEVADVAERALMYVGAEEAVPFLLEVLRSDDLETRRRAIRLLGALGDERARKPLRTLASDRSLKPFVEEALAGLRPQPGYSLSIQMLGPFEVRRGAGLVSDKEWRTARARTLLQFLASRRGQMISKERILEVLWPETDASSADGSFRFTLNALHKALEPGRPEGSTSYFVVRQGDAYGIAPTAEATVDSEEFARLVRDARAAPRVAQQFPGEAVRLYESALALYKDDFLPEHVYDDWTSADRERLRETYFLAASDLAEILLKEGRLGRVVELARGLLEQDPCREDATRLVMRAHMLRGDRTAAIRAYQSCVRALEREFGLEPLPETQRLYEDARSARR